MKDKVTVLLGGSFHPMTGGHFDLINRYVIDPTVNEIKIFVSQKIRGEISQETALTIILKLLENIPKVTIKEVEEYSPMIPIYEFIKVAPPGKYALASSTKEDYYKRVNKFVKYHSVGGKYFNDIPKGVKIIELSIDASPLNYYGRSDDFENKPICASILRNDVINNDFENFKTNYPGCTNEIINIIWNLLKKK